MSYTVWQAIEDDSGLVDEGIAVSGVPTHNLAMDIVAALNAADSNHFYFFEED